MTVNDNNRGILGRLRQAIEAFHSGEIGMDDAQAMLRSSADLLENDGSGATELVRLAEADIEEIRFTRLLDEQRPAVAFRLDALLESLGGEAS
ncbi:hypothetical protein [Jiangella anatolica]|uniref:Uncharacterized protein n=1 Tax=Jiangella anatolica TaxID=2670374 RepID=A0A2W2C107_9ACTN|nr:hypothetical protein [Jiangella anatolica]PZF79456.1 hypothetical protein C1I92_31045 [Jiangella anatolica]